MMHVLYLGYWYDGDMATVDDLLARHRTTAGWAGALAATGSQVTVVQRFRHDETVTADGVSYRLVRDVLPPQLSRWQIPLRFHREVAALAGASRTAVVHFNGLLFPLQLRALRRVLPRDTALVAQHHAEKPWRGLLRNLQASGLRAADAFLFAAGEAAAPWRSASLIQRRQRVFEVMEGSTHFRRGDHDASRARTGLHGDPVVLWVGRLNANKDPLTVLEGFERALPAIPAARLYMVFSEDPLLPEVRSRIQRCPALRSSVSLLGTVPHAAMEDLYNSADYFVSGSHYEGSGYALAEAMACGVVPVVTDIPAFRTMTGGGSLGACWRAGDAQAFAVALQRVWRERRRDQALAVTRHFADRLSYPAIARDALAAYSSAMSARNGARR